MTEPIKKFSALEQVAIDRAIEERRSVRAFLPNPVDQKIVENLLKTAARAPSGTNMQPWRVYVLAGQAREKMVAALMAQLRDNPQALRKGEYKYYPDEFFEPYLSRRRQLGGSLYALLGIEKGDKIKMAAQMARNFCFFDAPVAMIFTIDRRLEIGSWLDYGYFLGCLSIAARANGLETCSQAALVPFHETIRTTIGLPQEEIVIGSMCLGYADWTAPVNALRTSREPIENFANFHGF